ncbi:MAG TPA: hypothetical protein VL132_17895 [Planctomycetaceae bacterium]|nr:hypothetical protein [Planctomycetaceae bacterium]
MPDLTLSATEEKFYFFIVEPWASPIPIVVAVVGFVLILWYFVNRSRRRRP